MELPSFESMSGGRSTPNTSTSANAPRPQHRPEPLPHENHHPGSDDRQPKPGVECDSLDRCKAEAEQDAGQHGIGKRSGYHAHSLAERLKQARQDDENRTHDEGTSRSGEATLDHADAGEKSCTGVDQAQLIGIRFQSGKMMPSNPIKAASTKSADAT